MITALIFNSICIGGRSKGPCRVYGLAGCLSGEVRIWSGCLRRRVFRLRGRRFEQMQFEVFGNRDQNQLLMLSLAEEDASFLT
jgi:hypothetical protein